MLSMAVLDLFCILVAKFTVCDGLYVVNNEESCFFPVAFREIICVYVSAYSKFGFWFVQIFQSITKIFSESIKISCVGSI